MLEVYYTTGTAAKALGISSYQLRRLCEAEIVGAELTEGGHWRIPTAEVARLKREGIPPIPQPLTEGGAKTIQSPPKPQTAPQDLCGPPSEELICSAEDVTITENRLRKRKIEREAEEVEDWFREREVRLADQAAGERRSAVEAALQAGRLQWENKWNSYALEQVPLNTPSEIKTDVHDLVQAALGRLRPEHPDEIVRQLMDAAVDRALAPFRRIQEIKRIIEDAVDRLPLYAKYGSGSTWKLQATEEAHLAVRQLGGDASLAEVEATACRVVERVTRQFEHEVMCSNIVDSITLCLLEGSAQEQEDAGQAVARAVAVTPANVTLRELEVLRDQTLKPIKDAIAGRRHKAICEEAMRSASWKFPFEMDDQLKGRAVDSMNAALKKLSVGTPRNEISKVAELTQQPFLKVQQVRAKKEHLIGEGLREIYPYLMELSKDWEFDKSPWNLERELTHTVRDKLQKQIRGEETHDEVKKHVRVIVNYELDIR